ncbi:hypothetical protein [Thermodesulfovibrio sp. TK110]
MTLTLEEKRALAEYRIRKAKEIFEEASRTEDSLNKAHEFLIMAEKLLERLMKDEQTFN